VSSKSRDLKVVLTGDARDLQRAFDAGGRSADQFAGRMARAGTVAQLAGRQIDDSGRGVQRHERAVTGLNHALGNTTHQLKAVQGAISVLKFPALITGAGLATQAVSSLTAGVVGLGSALAPASGALVAAGSVGSAAAQGLGVFKLATKDLTQALAGNKKALEKLTPEARAFVQELRAMQPEVRELQRAAQKGLLPGAEQGLKSAHRNFGAVKQVVRETGDALGDVAAQAGKLAGSKGFGRDLERQGQRNALTIRRLGDAGLHLADAGRHILIAGGPLTGWLTKTADEGAKAVDVWARGARKSGEAAHFFGETRQVLEQLGVAGGHVAHSLGAISAEAKPLGDDLLASIVKASARMDGWTHSLQGRNSLREYFHDAEAPLMATGRLVADVGKAFFRLGHDPQLAPLIDQVRTELVPTLEHLIGSTTAQFGPHLVHTLTEVLDLFGHMAGSSGPLVAFVDLIGHGAEALNTLLDDFPGLNSALVTLAGAGGLYRALGLAKALTGVGRIQKMLQGVGGATSRLTPIQVASTAAGGVPVATGGAAARVSRTTRGVERAESGAIMLGSSYEDARRQRLIARRLEAGLPAERGGAMPGRLQRLGTASRAGLGSAGGALRGAGAGAMAAFGGPWGVAAGAALVLAPIVVPQVVRDLKSSGDFGLPKNSGVRNDLAGVAPLGFGGLEKKLLPGRSDVPKDLDKFTHQVDELVPKLQKLGDTRGLAEQAQQARDLAKRFPEARGALLDFANSVEQDLGHLAIPALQRMEKIGGHSLHAIWQASGDAAFQIEQKLGPGTHAAATAMGRNFEAAAAAVKRSMDAGKISVKTGTDAMAGFMAKALDAYGVHTLSKGQLKQYYNGRDPVSGKPMVNRPGGYATGGYIGSRGERGQDLVDITVGRGEYIANAEQQEWIEPALRATYGFGLTELTGRASTPHYAGGRAPRARFAGGGIAGMVSKASSIDSRHYPYRWGGGHDGSFSGPYDCSGAVSAVLHAGGVLDAPRVSGDFMHYGAPGPGAVTLFANPKHVYMRIGGRYFGTSGANPGGGAGWFSGAPRPGFAVRHISSMAAPRIPRQRMRSGLGEVTALGQLELDGGRGALQHVLNAAYRGQFAGHVGGGDAQEPAARKKRRAKHAAGGFAGLVRLARAGGWRGRNAQIAAAVAYAESRGNQHARHVNSDGSIDLGPWQVNSVHGFDSGRLVNDAVYSAKAAHDVWEHQGWGAWTTFRSGAYKAYLDDAHAAARTKASHSSTSSSSSSFSAPSPAQRARHEQAAADRLMRPVTQRLHADLTTAVGYDRYAGGALETLNADSAPAIAKAELAARRDPTKAAAVPAAHKKVDDRRVFLLRVQIAALKAEVRKYNAAVRGLQAQLRRKGLSKGERKAISARIKTYHGKRAALLEQGRALGIDLRSALIDVQNDDLDIVDANGSVVQGALDRIDSLASAGLISPEDARAARSNVYTQALSGGFGKLSGDETTSLKAGQLSDDASGVSGELSHIDDLEYAGEISSDEAKRRRHEIRSNALNGAYGPLSDHDRLQIKGDDRRDEQADPTTQALADAIKALADEEKRRNDFADGVLAVTSHEAVRALADVISGQIGARTAARALTPGDGSSWRF
jgi:hypothetical protein